MYRLDLSKEDNIYSQPLMYLMELLRRMLLNCYLFLINKQSHKNLMHSVINPHSSLHKSVQGRRLRRRRLRKKVEEAIGSYSSVYRLSRSPLNNGEKKKKRVISPHSAIHRS
jgi:hypothetical protein